MYITYASIKLFQKPHKNDKNPLFFFILEPKIMLKLHVKFFIPLFTHQAFIEK